MTNEQDPADRTVFEVSQEKWDEFMAMLDEPPKDIPKLRELFRRRNRIVRQQDDD